MKTIYYTDELNDEFSNAKIVPRKIDSSFKYNKSLVWEFFSYLMQNKAKKQEALQKANNIDYFSTKYQVL